MSRAAPLTLLTLALCWPAWLAGGWLFEALGVPELALPGRVLLLFVVLGLAEALLSRLAPPEGGDHG